MAAQKVTWPEAFETVGSEGVHAWKDVSIFDTRVTLFGMRLWLVVLAVILIIVAIGFFAGIGGAKAVHQGALVGGYYYGASPHIHRTALLRPMDNVDDVRLHLAKRGLALASYDDVLAGQAVVSGWTAEGYVFQNNESFHQPGRRTSVRTVRRAMPSGWAYVDDRR